VADRLRQQQIVKHEDAVVRAVRVRQASTPLLTKIAASKACVAREGQQAEATAESMRMFAGTLDDGTGTTDATASTLDNGTGVLAGTLDDSTRTMAAHRGH